MRCGVIANAYFNQPDGWYYVDGIIWDDKAQELINKGWSVSCSYDYLAFNDEGGEENNIHYDKEFTQLNFTHLAIVDNPRYERANIVFNSKDEEKGKWITIKGNHVFIPDGKSVDEVIKEKFGGKEEQLSSEQLAHRKGGLLSEIATAQRLGMKEKENKLRERYDKLRAKEARALKKEEAGGSEEKSNKPSGESNTTKDTRRHIDRIEKLIKKYNLEPHEEEELLDELGSFEAKLDEGLEPREEEELREQLFDFEDDIKRHQEMKKEEDKKTSKDEDYNREADIALTMMAQDYEKRGNQGTVDRANELKEKLKNGEELTEKDKAHIKMALDTYKPREHTEEAKQRKDKINKLRETLKGIAHKNEKDEQSISYVPIDPVPYGKEHTQYWGVDETGKTQYTTENKQKIYGVGLYKDYNGKEKLGFYIDYSDKPHWEVKKEPENLLSYYGEPNAMTPEQFDDVYKKVVKGLKKNKTNNSKEQDMAIIDELKKLIFKVENNKENETMVENEKVDKRKLIDEVAGIMKSAGCDDEDIRTAIGKMEKIGYDDSEASADNKKVKNEADEEDKDEDKKEDKVDNESEEDKEKAEDLKEEEKKDIDNKCKNSKEENYFDRLNKIYNSAKKIENTSVEYEDKQARLDAGKEYFG